MTRHDEYEPHNGNYVSRRPSPHATLAQLEAADELLEEARILVAHQEAKRLRAFWELGRLVGQLIGLERAEGNLHAKWDPDPALNQYGSLTLLDISDQTGIDIYDLLFALKLFRKCPQELLVKMCHPGHSLSGIRFRRSVIGDMLEDRNILAEQFTQVIEGNLNSGRSPTYKRHSLSWPVPGDGRSVFGCEHPGGTEVSTGG